MGFAYGKNNTYSALAVALKTPDFLSLFQTFSKIRESGRTLLTSANGK